MREDLHSFRNRPKVGMDPLSDMLSLLRPSSAVSAGLRGGGEWAIRFPSHSGIKFNAVMSGSCWVIVDGETEPTLIRAGDCFLLTRGRPFLFATDLSLRPVDARAIYENARHGVATFGDGGDFFVLGGRFEFEGDWAEPLIEAMPAVVHVADATSHAEVVRWSLHQLAAEVQRSEPGGRLMANHLAQIMLLQILRLWIAGSGIKPYGWLGALRDRRIAAALSSIHREPAERWTLASLAAKAGMSRSSFAKRFRDLVGQPPIDYLVRWRMRLAAHKLQAGLPISRIAYEAGYASDAAFSGSFRRIYGTAPSHARRQLLQDIGCPQIREPE